MKKISELGISLWPWNRSATSAYDSTGECVFNCCTWNENAIKDARLISEAPELYECLREAVVEFCHNCEDKKIENCRGKCFVAKWRDALAKANGESEEKK